MQRQLDDLKGTFDQPDEAVLEQAKQLVPDLERSPQAQREFVNLIRSVLPRPQDPTDDASDLFFNLPGDEVLRLLEPPILPGGGPGGGGGALGFGLMEEAGAAPLGGAAGIGDLFGGITAAARRLLNYATYYQMKERAGTDRQCAGCTRCCARSRPPTRTFGSIWSATASAAGSSRQPRSARPRARRWRRRA